MAIKTIIINRDRAFVESLKHNLEEEGYLIEVVHTMKEAIENIKNKYYELVILDIVLPDGNGLALCREIRNMSPVPIVVLTEKEDDLSQILALDYGADDYIVRPINMQVFKAKLKAILRRVNMDKEGVNNTHKQIIKIDDFIINTLGRRITINGRSISLTGKEFDLFYLLVSHPGRVFTREELLKIIWGYEYYGDVRTVDVHIRRLRKKIEEDYNNAEFIHTKWGVGYYFKPKKAKEA